MHSSFAKPWWHTQSVFSDLFARLPQQDRAKFGDMSSTLDVQFAKWVDSFAHSSAYDAFAHVACQE
eukprot:1435078-Karenia_brevis.AAC.1